MGLSCALSLPQWCPLTLALIGRVPTSFTLMLTLMQCGFVTDDAGCGAWQACQVSAGQRSQEPRGGLPQNEEQNLCCGNQV